jgi:hypothetical protein
MSVTLFDNKGNRKAGWLGPMETTFAFLNRSARPEERQVRRLLESWFRKYPTGSNKHVSLRARFRSDTSDHTAAFFELYCYTLLRRHRFAIKIEPSLSGVPTAIDFLACRGQKHLRCLRLEAKVVGDSNEDTSIRRNLVQLLASLNAVDSPTFRFSVAVLHGARTPLPVKAIQRDVRGWLASLDPAQVAASRSPLEWRLTKRYDGWEFAFVPRVRPQRERDRDNVSSHNIGAWMGSHDRIRENLGEKASKYGTLTVPYVVAIDALGVRELINRVGATLLSTDARVSFWATHPQVSAVLAVHELLPWSCARQTPILWHNPHATYPLGKDLWKGTQRVWNSKTSEWTDVPGKPICDLLGLAPTWPQ